MAEPTATATTVGWFPVVTLLIGLAAGYFSDALRDRRALKREREARDAVRRDQLAEHRTEFQRQTLLDLQKALYDLMHETTSLHNNNEMEYRQSQVWGEPDSFYGDLYQKASDAARRTAMLNVVVRDDEVREMVQRVRQLCDDVPNAVNPADSRNHINEASALFVSIQERIGKIVRTIHDGDAPLPQKSKAVSSAG